MGTIVELNKDIVVPGPKRPKKNVRLIFYRAVDPDGEWEMVKPEEVPKTITGSDEHMTAIVDGLMAKLPGSDIWWRAEEVPLNG